jgi:CRP-like cAMP-binding protein
VWGFPLVPKFRPDDLDLAQDPMHALKTLGLTRLTMRATPFSDLAPFLTSAMTTATPPLAPRTLQGRLLQLQPARAVPAGGHVRRRKWCSKLDTLVATRRSVQRGDTPVRSGEAFQSLYAVRTGFFKTCVGNEDGRDQVTGFQMAGELLGLDGIGTDATPATPWRWRTRRSA